MSDLYDPCSSCGGQVRIREIRTPTLANVDDVTQVRICPNRQCPTNETPRTLGTPAP